MSLELFEEYFYVDETSPSGLRWKKEIKSGNGGRIVKNKVNSVAGHLDPRGYWSVMLNKKIRKCHRVILTLLYGEIPIGMVTDHINRNTSDNSLSNLRLVSISINSKNLSFAKNNTSGVTGITFNGPTLAKPHNNHWIYR